MIFPITVVKKHNLFSQYLASNRDVKAIRLDRSGLIDHLQKPGTDDVTLIT